ncbi:hypothetical protein [Haloarchaeobius sp. HRN-SO-5]|uniref:hypothetical protein n=1 Tax=Haloarchaeobius sp. HRN-SO-5 TaxID=3446118 RepID=UPI003EB7BF06
MMRAIAATKMLVIRITRRRILPGSIWEVPAGPRICQRLICRGNAADASERTAIRRAINWKIAGGTVGEVASKSRRTFWLEIPVVPSPLGTLSLIVVEKVCAEYSVPARGRCASDHHMLIYLYVCSRPLYGGDSKWQPPNERQ